MPANLEYSAVATGLENVVFIPIPKKSNAKECSSLVQFSSKFTAYVWQSSSVVVEDTEVPFYLSKYSSN